MMSLSLPPEILDLILDHLHDESTTLKTCSTLSKSWVSRARAHIFADVEFCPISSPIESWTRVFPDPSNSPAHYTRNLSIGTYSFYTRSVDAHPWIPSFRRVTKLAVNTIRHGDDSQISFSQLHGFSPVLKRFLLIYSSVPPSEVFDLFCSFPSLEDLALISLAENEPESGWTIPSTSPKLTGELVLRMGSGIRSDARRLLDLPGGLHFSTISITSPIRDAESIADLVSRCSNTLESLGISYYSPDLGVSAVPPPLDLSKATRLEDVEFYLNTKSIQWITRTLQSAKPERLRRITISTPSSFTSPVRATVLQEWEDLDHVLAQMWISRSVRSTLKYAKTPKCEDVMTWVRVLLPELTSRGIIDVVEK